MDAPVSVLDAATGKTLKVLDNTEHCGELVYFRNRLYVTVRDVGSKTSRNSVRAIDPVSGEMLWESAKYDGFPGFHPQHDNPTLTLGDGRLFFLDEECLACQRMTIRAFTSTAYPATCS
jgi:hypothetical protein